MQHRPAHGGDVTVDSREGDGSTFRLRIPMLADDPAGVTFRETVLLTDAIDRLPASFGGYKFPEATSART